MGSAERYHQDDGLTNSLMGAAPPQWLVEVTSNVNQIRMSLECVEARQENARIGRLNSMELISNTSVTMYRAKQKEVCLSVISFSDTISL